MANPAMCVVRFLAAALSLLLLGVAGCTPSKTEPASESAPAQTAGPATLTTTTSGAEAAPPGNVEPAASRVGAQAKQYGSGPIATPIATYATVRERLPMIQIQHGLQAFEAENSRPPRDMAEFTEKILKPANITLPPLKAGESYFFDASKKPHGELMILLSQPAP